MKPRDFQKESIQRELKRMGFSRLEDKDLIVQMAICVRDHEHFRAILLKVEPDKRTTAYEAFRAHLRFTPKQLEVYLSEAAQKAEAEKLPVWNEKDQTITDYDNYHGTGRPYIEVLAERAINRRYLEDGAKGSLTLTCAKCTKQVIYPALDRIGAYAMATHDGWVFVQPPRDGADDSPKKEISICPDCPAVRSNLAHA